MDNVFLYVGGVLISIIGYFVKATMSELEKLRNKVDTNRDDINVISSSLSVLQNDHINKHTHLSDKFDNLTEVVKELTKEIKEMNKELKKKD